MKTYDERVQSVSDKIRKRKRRKILVTCCKILAAVAVVLFLFWPYENSLPDVSMYSDSPYYGVIQKINAAQAEAPMFYDNFDFLSYHLFNFLRDDDYRSGSSNLLVDDDGSATSGSALDDTEVTDNQVAGVTEGDLFKRSDRFLFYLRNDTINDTEISVYTIDREESVQIFGKSFSDDRMTYYFGSSDKELYLSEDGSTVTVLVPCSDRSSGRGYVCVINMDVTESGSLVNDRRMYFSGDAITSRMVDGELLIMTEYAVDSDADFSDESTFLPQIGQPGQMHSIPSENIIAPDVLSSTRYTVVYRIDSETLEVTDTAAFLSYSDTVYVSENNIYVTRDYEAEEDQGLNGSILRSWTEIAAIRYADGPFTYLGSASVEGFVRNQYSLDEHEGILRIVTSINEFKGNRHNQYHELDENASLYCVNLDTWQIVARAERFAPAGEEAMSVRFDGDYAYVCTAEKITMTDPVYFFDLSDLENITYKDTGTIDGYSSSLVDFGDHLLGIGYNDSRDLKIEVYEVTDTGVQSVCSYELDASFSQTYKAYLIDRENRLVGLAINERDNSAEYLLLQFDGDQLKTVLRTYFDCGTLSRARAVVIDGYLYMLGDEFKVEKVWTN